MCVYVDLQVDDGNHHWHTEGSSESSLLDLQKGDGMSSTTGSNNQFGSLKHGDDGDCGERNREEAKWMSSKMRLMRKMMNSYPSDQQAAVGGEISSSFICSNTVTPVRVCSDCSTTKTPLWRSGPQGPKVPTNQPTNSINLANYT